MPAVVAANCDSVRAVSTTRAPCSAKSFAEVAPISRPMPVTRAILSVKRPIGFGVLVVIVLLRVGDIVGGVRVDGVVDCPGPSRILSEHRGDPQNGSGQ